VRLPGHRAPVARVAVSDDGLRIASVDFSGYYRLWDTVHPRERAEDRRVALERRRLESVVRPRVDALLRELALPSLVVERLRTDTTLDPILRTAAVRLARQRWDEVTIPDLENWEVVGDPRRPPAEYERALERSRALLRRFGANGNDNLVATAGWALVRLGRDQEALDEMGELADDNVFCALAAVVARWRLGEPDRARELLALVRRGANPMSSDQYTVGEWSALIREVTAFVESGE
jgi:hypothetical protein